MAPQIPAEIDVFTIPHSRMKELVNIYTQKVQCMDYRDCHEVYTLLDELSSILYEFKSHESIENMFIMDQLKNRLKQRHIYNSAVCNCHNDNRITEMMKLVKTGKSFRKSTIGERISFGQELQDKFFDFVQQFLPHMEEEENIFQPLLVEHFEYDELCILKEVVLEQHELIKDPQYHEKAHLDTPETDEAIKDFRDLDTDACYIGSLFTEIQQADKFLNICSRIVEQEGVGYLITQDQESNKGFKDLPAEVLTMIFGYLEPPDRGRCAQVCSAWNEAVYSPSLWKELFPVQWAAGIWVWENCNISHELEDEATRRPSSQVRLKHDEDADVDESEDTHLDPIVDKQIKMFTSLIDYILPRVGIGVEKLILDGACDISSRHLQETVSLCPNISHISAAYTRFDYYTFKGLRQYNCLSKLESLDLQGCEFIDDAALSALTECLVLATTSATSQYCFVAGCPRQNLNMTHYICPYDVRWMKDETQLTEIEELHGKTYHCKYMTCQDNNSIHDERTVREPSLRSLNVSGCWKITDEGLWDLCNAGLLNEIHLLNLSGCYHITGSLLNRLVRDCPFLSPENLTYCNEIMDGPYPTSASGCDSISHPMRVCCKSLVRD